MKTEKHLRSLFTVNKTLTFWSYKIITQMSKVFNLLLAIEFVIDTLQSYI